MQKPTAQAYSDDAEAPSVKFNTKAAIRFCELIDPDANAFDFRTLGPEWLKAGYPERKQRNRRGNLTDEIGITKGVLKEANRLGRGVFMTVNETDGAGVKAENITRVRAVYADLDDGLPSKWRLRPSFIVNTSPDKYQAYWLVENEMTRAQFASVMRGIGQRWPSAKDAKDIARVLRVPGFWHQKRRDRPHRVKFEWEPEGEPVRYSAGKLVKVFGVEEPERPKPSVSDAREWTDDDIEGMLDALPATEWEGREGWLTIGMALHDHFRGSSAGYNRWCRYASRSDKFNEKDSERVWRSFSGGGVTLGTLVHLAKESGWRPEPRHEAKPAKKVKAKRGRVRAVSWTEFMMEPAPKLDPILGPWLTTGSLALIHAWRGTGKSSMALAIANAAARGEGLLGWHSDGKPRKVLYVDGEMPMGMLQTWMEEISGNPTHNNLKILTHHQFYKLGRIMLNLYTEEGREELDDVIEACGAKVIILNSITTLCRGGEIGSSNDAESWSPVGSWLLRHRNEGRAVIFLHHEGKGGTQRGTSAKEDSMDSVMRLKAPKRDPEDEGGEGALELTWEKHRNFYGDDAEPMAVVQRTEEDPKRRTKRRQWHTTEAPAVVREREEEEKRQGALQALREGESLREVGKRFGVSHEAVRKWRDAEREARTGKAKLVE